MANTVAVPFLDASVPQIGGMRNANQAAATYEAGTSYTFSGKAGDVGLAEFIRVRVFGTATQTAGTGTSPGVAWSAMESFFTSVRVKLGDTPIKEVHPFYFRVRNLTRRRNFLPGHAPANQSNIASKNLPFALPTLTTSGSAYNFVWELLIPLRWLRSELIGGIPTGDSTNPVNVELFTPQNLYGVDPQNNLFIVSGGTTVAVTATVTATYVYRTAMSYTPGISIAAPVVGQTVRATSTTQAIDIVGDETPVTVTAKRPTSALFLILQDGNATPVPATGANGSGLSTNMLSRLRFVLSNQATVFDLDTDEKLYAYLDAFRLSNEVDLPDGVVPITFDQEGWLSGFYNDPNLEDIAQFPNFGQWRNAFVGFTVASGYTLNSSGSDLARAVLYQEFFDAVSY